MAHRSGGGRRVEDVTVRISKALTYLLRHGAEKEGLPMRSDGYVPVEAILNHKNLKNLQVGLRLVTRISSPHRQAKRVSHLHLHLPSSSIRQLENIVETNDKKRFELKKIDDVLHIKATQGHTTELVKELELTPITLENVASYPTVIHGTNFRAWQSIAKTG